VNGEASVRDLYFSGNRFHHSSFPYEYPLYKVGKPSHTPAAVTFHFATNITFVHNTIEVVGGYALQCRYGQHGETSDAFKYPEIHPSAHGDNLIAWNTFNRAAEMKSDAGTVAVR